MGPWLSVTVLVLAGWAALKPVPMAWLYLAGVAAFEIWLAGTLRSAGAAAVAPGEPPYDFTPDEARLVARYRFYFTYPALARHAGSVLAAIGLTALVLAPWLLTRQAYLEAALSGLNLLAVGWLTRRVAPTYALSLAASRGKPEARQMLALVEPVWAKIRKGNQSAAS